MKFILFFILSVFLASTEANGATNEMELIEEEWETFKVM